MIVIGPRADSFSGAENEILPMYAACLLRWNVIMPCLNWGVDLITLRAASSMYDFFMSSLSFCRLLRFVLYALMIFLVSSSIVSIFSGVKMLYRALSTLFSSSVSLASICTVIFILLPHV